MGIPLPIDNLQFAKRLYFFANKYRGYFPKWEKIKEAMENEFQEYDFKPNTYASLYHRLRVRYGLIQPSESYDYIERRPIEELLGDDPLQNECCQDPAPEPAAEQPKAKKEQLGTIDEEISKSVHRIKLQQTKQEYTKALNERTRTEILADVIRQGVKALPEQAAPAPYILVPNGSREYDVILLLSDLQLGQYTTADETGGLVEYSTEIFEERLANLERQLVRRVTELRKVYRIRKIWVFGLGDFVENETIFKGQKSRIDTPVIEQFLQGSKLIADMLYRLLGLFDEVEFIGVFGNHGRIGDKGEANLYTNWDYLLYEFIKVRLQDQPRLKITNPKAWWHIVRVRGSRFLLSHGENIQRWMGIPYYGLARADANLTMLLQSKGYAYDYWISAHQHNSATIDRPDGERIINGAFPSGSVFSVHQLNAASQPSQTLLFVGDKRVEWQEKLRIAEVE